MTSRYDVTRLLEVCLEVHICLQTFHFTIIRQEMQVSVFQLPRDISYSEQLTESFFPAHHRALVPGNIHGLLRSYGQFTSAEFAVRLDKVAGLSHGTPLASLVNPAAYSAAGKAFYGESYPAADTMNKFVQFDSVFHIIAGGLPLWLIPNARKAWDDLIAVGEEHVKRLRRREEKVTDFMEMMLDEAEKHGWVSFCPTRCLATG